MLDTGAKPRKWRTILMAFADGRSMTRFDAERLGDHALNSTVAALQSRGVRIVRDQTVVTGRFGEIHCKRYRLAPESLERARELLDGATMAAA